MRCDRIVCTWSASNGTELALGRFAADKDAPLFDTKLSIKLVQIGHGSDLLEASSGRGDSPILASLMLRHAVLESSENDLCI